MQHLNQIQLLAVLALPVVLAITVHEAAHGWVANRLGDRTALMLGRVTFNPVRHIDLIGTIVVPALSFLLAGFLFGWAKPVPVNPRNLHHPRRDMALVALAGPAANLVMGLAWGGAIYLGGMLIESNPWVAVPLAYMGAAGVLINVVLMVLNLLPLLPLDGGRVLNAILPRQLARYYARIEPFGLIILLALLATGLLGRLLQPLVIGVLGLMPGADVVAALFFS